VSKKHCRVSSSQELLGEAVEQPAFIKIGEDCIKALEKYFFIK